MVFHLLKKRHISRPTGPRSESSRTSLASMRQEIIETTLAMIRAEYTVMPRFGFHQPLDYLKESAPPQFGPVVNIPGELLPLPAPADRFGYPADDTVYLRTGQDDADIFKAAISKYLGHRDKVAILEFGCSVGRVLRHFERERRELSWKLHGIDVQARCIEWLRLHFPEEYCVTTGTLLPHLPFEDNSFDVVYGVSVFTHVKYLWDAWLLELRRVLRPGGLLIQTIHTENAWSFYHAHRHLDWVQQGHAAKMLETPEMNVDWYHYGDISVSQSFWKADIARRNWRRYFDVLDLLPPQHPASFQDVIIARKRMTS